MIGIYKITSPSGKIYIGQSVNIANRLSKYKNANCKTQRVLYNSIIKYGWKAHKFEVLCECDIIELNDKERYYQDLFNVVSDSGLNCMLTTSSTKSGKASESTISILTGRKLSDATREKMRNKKLSEETRSKISQSNKGRVVSDDTRNKISQSNKGKKRTQEYIDNLKLRVISDETKAKIKESKKGFKHTEEYKKIMSIKRKGIKPSKECVDAMVIKNSKKVIDKSTGIIYNSITELCKKLGLKRTTLNAKLVGTNYNDTYFDYY